MKSKDYNYLIEDFHSLLSEDGFIFVVYEERKPEIDYLFFEKLKENNFLINVVKDEELDETYQSESIKVYKITNKKIN